MFLVNGMKAQLIQYNREPLEEDEIYDDEQKKTITIKCCPYKVSQKVKFGEYTHPEATGYYIVHRFVDVKKGDQIIFLGKYSDGVVHTILEVEEGWIFNRVENKILVVK